MNSNKRLGNKLFKNFFGGSDNNDNNDNNGCNDIKDLKFDLEYDKIFEQYKRSHRDPPHYKFSNQTLEVYNQLLKQASEIKDKFKEQIKKCNDQGILKEKLLEFKKLYETIETKEVRFTGNEMLTDVTKSIKDNYETYAKYHSGYEDLKELIDKKFEKKEHDELNFFQKMIYYKDTTTVCPLIVILFIIFGIIYLLTPTLFPNYFKNIGIFDIIFNILNIAGAIIICSFISREGMCASDSHLFSFEYLAHIIAISYPILLLLLHISTVNKKKEKKNENINRMTNFANTNNLETSDEALIDNLENNNLDSDELENTENTNL